MSKGIPISPKHGLNPTIPICFWCGKQKNEIALLGKFSRKETVRTPYGSREQVVDPDAEAPRCCVINYEPCDECKANFEQGVLVMEATSTPRDKD